MNLRRLILVALASLVLRSLVIAQTSQPAATASTRPDAGPLYGEAIALISKLSDDDMNRLANPRLDDAAAAALLAKEQPAIALIRQAATMPTADWGIDGDAQETVKVAQHVRSMASLMVASARQELRHGQPAAAADDLVVALAVSRHASVGETTMVTKMGEQAAAHLAIEEFAAVLAALPKEVVAALPAKLAKLPASPTMAQLVRGEQAFARATAPKQGAAAVVLVAGLTNYYDALAKGGDLPPDKFAKLVDEQVAKYPANPFAGILATSFKRAREMTAMMEARQTMLMTAIDVVLHGDGVVAASKDPAGGGPFAFEKTAKGFRLRSALKHDGKPVELLVVGSAP
jgi:hypothetical protein